MVSVDERKDESVRPDIGERVEVTASDASRQFGALMNRAIAGERTVITRHGKPIAVLVPACAA